MLDRTHHSAVVLKTKTHSNPGIPLGLKVFLHFSGDASAARWTGHGPEPEIWAVREMLEADGLLHLVVTPRATREQIEGVAQRNGIDPDAIHVLIAERTNVSAGQSRP